MTKIDTTNLSRLDHFIYNNEKKSYAIGAIGLIAPTVIGLLWKSSVIVISAASCAALPYIVAALLIATALASIIFASRISSIEDRLPKPPPAEFDSIDLEDIAEAVWFSGRGKDDTRRQILDLFYRITSKTGLEKIYGYLEKHCNLACRNDKDFQYWVNDEAEANRLPHIFKAVQIIYQREPIPEQDNRLQVVTLSPGTHPGYGCAIERRLSFVK